MILDSKQTMVVEKTLKGFPKELQQFVIYCRSLKFEDQVTEVEFWLSQTSSLTTCICEICSEALLFSGKSSLMGFTAGTKRNKKKRDQMMIFELLKTFKVALFIYFDKGRRANELMRNILEK